ncbi:50S ribosomal protein L25/general stress protein Ctc [Orrella sp. 11846]|uniref:50S ribosomal protein L25/general stress protein Ctc n=1 Tax=Orrella sp. 11846 TaxID=3409913 RepID=UPI003B5A6BC9
MEFTATQRAVQGSSASRRLRRAGRVPAIVYGGTAPALNIELDHNEIYHALRKDAFHASILSMLLDGKKEQVILRNVQWHPYKQLVLHVDFQRISAKQAISTKVPLQFINGDESPAVKLESAVISHVMTELEIECLPADLPASIEVDLGNLTVGGTVNLADIELPAGVTYLSRGGDENPLLAQAILPAAARGADDEDVEADGDEESTGEDSSDES